MNNKAQKYFAERGVSVDFNGLGGSEALQSAFITATHDIVDTSESKVSMHVKEKCYARFYDMEPRKKLTGFESFDDSAREFKIKQSSVVSADDIAECLVVDNTSDKSDYKVLLGTKFSEIKQHPILLYLSGGLDSEFVARALIDNNITFTPIIFQWTTDKGLIGNTDDTAFALKFCATHKLTPIIKIVDIDTLWASKEFHELSEATGLSSAHLTTYVYMVNVMTTEYTTAHHLFGGEIRYKTNYIKDDNTLANLVFLNKTTPSYNNNVYEVSSGIYTTITATLTYTSSGAWTLYPSTPYNTWTLNLVSIGQNSQSGTWTDSPNATYEVRVLIANATPTVFPNVSETAYRSITAITNVCYARSTYPGSSNGDAQFTIQVRNTNSPANVKETYVQIMATRAI